MDRVRTNAVDEELLERVRVRHRSTKREYSARRPLYAAAAPPELAVGYAVVRAEAPNGGSRS